MCILIFICQNHPISVTFLIASRGKAMEIDNVVFRTSVAVAEPFTLTLFSFAILGLAVVRQRSTSKLSTMAQY
jgi:hypothetical protein